MIVTGYVVPQGALAPTVMLAVDGTPEDDTKGFALVNDTEMKEGAVQVRETWPLKAPVPVRVSVDDFMPPRIMDSDEGVAGMLKSGWMGFVFHRCNSGPKLPRP